MYLNSRLKQARIEKNLTQKQLAELLSKEGCNISHATISNWELNISRPDIDTLAIICKVLEKDGNYFFDFKNNDTSSLLEKIDLTGFTNEEIELIKKYIDFIKSQRKDI